MPVAVEEKDALVLEDHRAGHSRRRFLASSATAALMTGWTATMPAAASAGTAQTRSGQSAAKLQPFDMADVALGEGPFLHAQRMTEAYLLKLKPDRMLHNFRVNAGLKPKAPVYGGWESEATWEDINCHGHTLGHYLSGCALAYRSTRDQRFKQRIDYVAGELAACQKAAEPGWSAPSPRARRWLRHICAARRSPAFPGTRCTRSMPGLRDAALLADSERLAGVLLRSRTGAWSPPGRCPTPSSRRCSAPSTAA